MDHTEHTGILIYFFATSFRFVSRLFCFYSYFIFVNFLVIHFYFILLLLTKDSRTSDFSGCASETNPVSKSSLLPPASLHVLFFSLLLSPCYFLIIFFHFFLWCKYFFVTIADLWRIASLFWLKLQVRGGILLLFRSLLYLFLPSSLHSSSLSLPSSPLSPHPSCFFFYNTVRYTTSTLHQPPKVPA